MSVQERSKRQFTSPLQRNTVDKAKSEKELQEKLIHINQQIQVLQSQGLKEEELQLHIEKLHEYNQLKDVGQAVLGQLATLRSVRTQDVYKSYDLNVED